ncbi:MAG TPA: IS110 family transposase [Gammaproteobacteria bacterium]|nr:IS110 family transposase [Gammaproteobacteria bacterium]
MRTIGLDVHKHFTEVAILEPGREIQHSDRIRTTPAALRAFAKTLRSTDHVVLEASINTWPIAELLSAHAGRVVVSNPMRTRAIASAKVKTDRVDSAILAQLLAADFIPAVWVPDSATQALRRQASHRQSLVQQSTRLRNRIHAVLQRNLIAHSFTDLFGKAGRRWLTEVALPPDERHQVDSALRLLDAVDAEIRRIEEHVAQAALEDQRVLRLMTIPGVGLHTAVAIAAVIGDITRFPRPTHLVGYLGLDPRVRQSGSRPAHTGHISRQGQAHARGLLVEAAHSTIRVPGPLHAFYQRLRARRGPQIAIVAVARKLAVLAWHLLTHHTDYRWTPASLTASKRRRVELKAGAPSRRGHPARASEAKARPLTPQQEREPLQRAEEAYQVFVATRQRTRRNKRT